MVQYGIIAPESWDHSGKRSQITDLSLSREGQDAFQDGAAGQNQRLLSSMRKDYRKDGKWEANENFKTRVGSYAIKMGAFLEVQALINRATQRRILKEKEVS